MKPPHTIAALVALAAVSSVGARAQQRPLPTAQPAGVGQQPPASVRIATIDSRSFGDPRQGITRLVTARQSAEREFQPLREELQRATTRRQELTRQSLAIRGGSPAQADALSEQAEALGRDIDRRMEDAREALGRRAAELTRPVEEDIANALQAFARARGIGLILDVSKTPGMIMVVDQGADLTRAFIADFNARNPGPPPAAGQAPSSVRIEPEQGFRS